MIGRWYLPMRGCSKEDHKEKVLEWRGHNSNSRPSTLKQAFSFLVVPLS